MCGDVDPTNKIRLIAVSPRSGTILGHGLKINYHSLSNGKAPRIRVQLLLLTCHIIFLNHEHGVVNSHGQENMGSLYFVQLVLN